MHELSKMEILQLLLVFFVTWFQLGATTSCPNTTATGDTKPLYLLALLANYTLEYRERAFLAATIAQKEINNRSDILPGYHIELIRDTIEVCSSSEAGIGLSNLVKYTVSPPCRPVVAVMGLECSSHTSILSPVAGHEGFDLIQLSKASSPIFEAQNNQFPHLWRFTGAATVYSDTVLAIMDQFNWTRVGIVYSIDSLLYSELAMDIEQKIKQSGNKSVAFSLGIRGTKAYYLDAVISNIKSKETSVLVKLVDREAQALLLRAYHHGLVYPHYTWIHVLTHPLWLTVTLGKTYFYETSHGHLFLFALGSEDAYLVSNNTFSEYKLKYLSLYQKRVQPLLNISTLARFVEYFNYDMVWAIALAVNNSVSELNNRHLSIDNYTIGQPAITAVIEEQLKNLRFQGASGWIEFNQYRSVPTPIKVFWISSDSETYKQVGIYNSFHPLDFHVNINSSDLPSDTVPRLYEYILIPLPVAIVLYILTGGVIIFTTIQLILYLYYRHHKVIKATSPFLSLLMFAGCYLFCAAAIQLNTFSSFVLSPETFTAMAITNFVLIINGISLILITLFIKLLRVYRIFKCWNKDLGKQWNTLSLLLIILLLSTIPNIGLAVFIALKPAPTYSFYYYKFFRYNLPVIEIHTRIEPTSNCIFLIMVAIYTTVFLTLVLYMGIRIRKVKIKNFNSTGQVYLLLAVLVIAICLAISIVIIFLEREQEPIANAVMVTLFLIFVTACQLILFLPKILTAMFDRKIPKALSSLTNVLGTIVQFIFS